MKALIRISSFLSAFLLIALVGCASNGMQTSIMPRPDGTFDMVSTSDTEDVAYKNAEISAKKKCEEQHKQFAVVSHESIYQGVDKTKKQEVDVTNVAMAWVTGTSNKEDRSDDYKVTMKFTCS